MGSSPEGELCPVCAQQPAGCCTSLVAPSAASQAWLRVTEAVKPQLSSPAVVRTFLVGLLHSGLKQTCSGVIIFLLSLSGVSLWEQCRMPHSGRALLVTFSVQTERRRRSGFNW